MSSAVGVPLAAWFMPVRELAILRRELRLKVEETRPLLGLSRRPPRSGSYLADGRRPAPTSLTAAGDGGLTLMSAIPVS